MTEHAPTRNATTVKTSEQLRRGDVVMLSGVGGFSIAGFRRIGPGEVLVKLSWGELALLAHPGQKWAVLTAATPAPGTPHLRSVDP